MRILFLATLISLSSSVFASELNAVESLLSLIQPGTYQGVYNEKKCTFTLDVDGETATGTLAKQHKSVTHTFTKDDVIRFNAQKGEFRSFQVTRTEDPEKYSTDEFRFVHSQTGAFVVIEQIYINKRNHYRHIVECLLK
ncbi:MAG: hypothetical protein KUL82_12320 [Bdellovibrio sp.]|nr:hypothetical protein [Bdellovibrio sp.]